MRRLALRSLLLGLALTALALVAPRVRAADPDVTGTWKFLLVGPFQESELILVEVKDLAGKATATVKDFPKNRFGQPPRITDFSVANGVVTMGVDFGIPGKYTGKPVKNGSVTGILKINDQPIPARLVKTKLEKLDLAPPQQPESMKAYIAVRTEKDPKVKTAKLAEIIAKNPGSPSMSMVYSDMFKGAEAAGMPEATVRKLATDRIEGAKAFDQELATTTAIEVANELSTKKAYSALSLDLAKAAEADLAADASVGSRAGVAGALAAAARATGDNALLAKAEGQVKKFDADLDEEYHKKVPPFKPEHSAAGKDRKSDRVVLMELFTGAECPPCVAADVAFDALIDTYKPTEFVALQYHMHIPGPDPLTNNDAIARFKYYPDSQGTPTTIFNGKSAAGGGGGMGNAKAKYDEYRTLIDKDLEKPSQAKLNLNVVRKEDELRITASAQAEDQKNESLKLRLVLVEEQVRYTGRNNLRFHHHVVRALPGGFEGKALSKGSGKAEVTVNLADVRNGLEQYLSDTSKGGMSFPKALPPIDLNKLSVVAFVQDDSDKSVLNAAMTSLAETKAPTP